MVPSVLREMATVQEYGTSAKLVLSDIVDNKLFPSKSSPGTEIPNLRSSHNFLN